MTEDALGEGAVCKGCGKKIYWGITDGVKRIPLDPAPPVYRILRSYDGYGGRRLIVERDHNAFVSHFITCPNANEFSGSKKKEPIGGTE